MKCKVKIRIFGQVVPCIRKRYGGRYHSPDLTGIQIGQAKIIKLTKPSARRYNQWIVRFDDGSEKPILAHLITRGIFKGKNSGVIYSRLTNGKGCPIYRSVAGHSHFINKANLGYKLWKSYKGMPFYDEWNPAKGGLYRNAVIWIKSNLPRKRKGDHLHIIDRKIGFWPGNLIWIPKSKHRQEEMLNKILLENKNLRDRLRGINVQTN